MEYKTKKKAPKEKNGDLSKKKHVFSGIHVDLGECDDWHCTGHSSVYITCSCGYCEDIHSASSTEDAINRHRLAVVEHHLGLTFEEDDE